MPFNQMSEGKIVIVERSVRERMGRFSLPKYDQDARRQHFNGSDINEEKLEQALRQILNYSKNGTRT
jgi:hypothetical protein